MSEPTEINIDKVYPKLVGHTLHNMVRWIVRDESYLAFQITGMPSCCGMAILHSLNNGLDLDKVTNDLLKVIDANQTEVEGVGGFVAVTSDGESIPPKKFEDNQHWEKASQCINPGSGNTLTIWTLT